MGIFKRVRPDKMDQIDILLEKYAGFEELIYETMLDKYLPVHGDIAWEQLPKHHLARHEVPVVRSPDASKNLWLRFKDPSSDEQRQGDKVVPEDMEAVMDFLKSKHGLMYTKIQSKPDSVLQVDFLHGNLMLYTSKRDDSHCNCRICLEGERLQQMRVALLRSLQRSSIIR